MVLEGVSGDGPSGRTGMRFSRVFLKLDLEGLREVILLDQVRDGPEGQQGGGT